MRITTVVTYLTLSGLMTAFGQSVISAKAGVVHYTEGDVAVQSGTTMTPVESRTGGKFTELKDGQELATAEGRAEVLLNPGVFLRLGENSTIKMISTRLSDTRLELLRGVALVEVAEVAKDNAVTMLVKDASVTFSKMGLIRLDAESGIRAYKGEAQIMAGGSPQTLKEGRELQFANGNAIAKFDTKQGDPLYRWANRRAEYIAMANIASAHMAKKSYGGNISGLNSGVWYYNSFYNMMTFLPYGRGMYRSPFGYFYYTPDGVNRYYQAYLPSVPSGGGNGYGGGSGMGQGRAWNADNGYYTTMGRSAGAVSMPAPSAGAPAAAVSAAPAARGADVSTGRGGGGGGRSQ